MFKKKTLCTLALTGMLVFSGMPVMAEDLTLTQISPSGESTVTAQVSSTPGSVSYIVEIPDRIEFGSLTQPSDITTSHYAMTTFNATASEVKGLDDTGKAIALLAQDGSSTADDTRFRISGVDTLNSDKTLYYDVLSEAEESISAEGNQRYENGYLFCLFRDNETFKGTLQLDQNQLYDKDLTQWAGNYQGTIRFYSRYVDLADYN